MSTIYALEKRKTNSDLMIACHTLGYIDNKKLVADLTYGLGTFWCDWTPTNLIASDIDPQKSPIGYSVDFTHTPYENLSVGTVILDPPYKLNGTPTSSFDERYGVHKTSTIKERHQLMMDGITEAARITQPKGHLLFKCQDQVSSGRVQWQTRIMADHAEQVGFELVDSLLFQSCRAQPSGRRQIHARRNYSTLLVCQKRTTSKKET